MFLRPSGHGVIIEDRVRIAVDARTRIREAIHVVTHAHWDHLGGVRKGGGFSNQETAEILKRRDVFVEGVESLSVGKWELRFLNAGHIVGSAQILLLNGRDVLVTGDFKVESDVVVRGADVESVDVLVMDTTFGVPYFSFPSRRTLYRQLKVFVKDSLSKGESVVLFGYSVGKSQELTAFLNSLGIRPFVLPETHRVNALFGLEDQILRSLPQEPGVFILPPKFRKVLSAFQFQTGVPFRGIFASGWNPDLPLSSHADWKQTLEFVEKVSPEVVVTYGENAQRSAQFLKKEGFDAIALNRGIFL